MRAVKSLADLEAVIVRNLHRIPRDVDAVIGIPRSGMLAATSIALHLQKPLGTLHDAAAGRAFRRGGGAVGAGRILLVDDTVRTGKAMRRAMEQIGPKLQVHRLAVWDAAETPPGSVDLALETCPTPRAFAWNLWKHCRLERWVFDFDGVLCRDPSGAENDDGPRYEQFLMTVEPRFLPTRKIGGIITCRLEKYRDLTEAWLDAHGVEHGGLHMLDLPTKKARQEQGGRGAWKAQVYTRLDAELFVESNDGQARKIAAYSYKPVWCTDTQTFYPAS